jgi:RNA polymerase sigma-70 factor (sigma-E family)
LKKVVTNDSRTRPAGGPPRPDGAFEQFVDEHLAGLLRTAYLITWDLGEAEDAVQEALTRAARHWGRVAAMEHPRAYVRTIVVHQALRQRRRRLSAPTTAEHLDEVADRNHGDVQERFEQREQLSQMLGSLPRNQRAVLVLRYFEDLSEREIAEHLDWPVGTVKSTAARALQRLRHSTGADASGADESFDQPLPKETTP